MRCSILPTLRTVSLVRAPALTAQARTDPGRVRAGITDTTAFGARMERHLAAAAEALAALRA